jgi:hypothetical protein
LIAGKIIRPRAIQDHWDAQRWGDVIKKNNIVVD